MPVANISIYINHTVRTRSSSARTAASSPMLTSTASRGEALIHTPTVGFLYSTLTSIDARRVVDRRRLYPFFTAGRPDAPARQGRETLMGSMGSTAECAGVLVGRACATLCATHATESALQPLLCSGIVGVDQKCMRKLYSSGLAHFLWSTNGLWLIRITKRTVG